MAAGAALVFFALAAEEIHEREVRDRESFCQEKYKGMGLVSGNNSQAKLQAITTIQPPSPMKKRKRPKRGKKSFHERLQKIMDEVELEKEEDPEIKSMMEGIFAHLLQVNDKDHSKGQNSSKEKSNLDTSPDIDSGEETVDERKMWSYVDAKAKKTKENSDEDQNYRVRSQEKPLKTNKEKGKPLDEDPDHTTDDEGPKSRIYEKVSPDNNRRNPNAPLKLYEDENENDSDDFLAGDHDPPLQDGDSDSSLDWD